MARDVAMISYFIFAKINSFQSILYNILSLILLEHPPQTIIEALLGGVYAPCSLRNFTPFSLLPSIFQLSLLLCNFHCSFFISLCSLLLFNFSSCSLIISSAPCSISQSFAAPCSLFQFFVLPAPRLRIPCSLLPSLF